MSVKLRFARMGRPHIPFFKLVAIDHKSARDAKPIEVLGSFNALEKKKPDAVKVDRIRHWVSVGAQVSPSVQQTLKKLGLWNQVKPNADFKS